MILAQQDKLRRFLARRVKHREDRADLCQEVLLRAWEMFPGFRGRAKAGTWLLSIARHVVADYYRQKSTRPVSARLPATRQPRTRTDLVRETCDARERIEHCLSCIMANLPAPQQVAILLAEIYAVTDKEAARTLRTPLSVFKHRLRKARAELRTRCQKQCALLSKTGIAPQNTPAADKKPAGCAATACLDRRMLKLRDQLVREILFFNPRQADRLTAGTSNR